MSLLKVTAPARQPSQPSSVSGSRSEPEAEAVLTQCYLPGGTVLSILCPFSSAHTCVNSSCVKLSSHYSMCVALSSQFALARGQREMQETATGEVAMLPAAAAVRHCFGCLGLPKDHPV